VREWTDDQKTARVYIPGCFGENIVCRKFGFVFYFCLYYEGNGYNQQHKRLDAGPVTIIFLRFLFGIFLLYENKPIDKMGCACIGCCNRIGLYQLSIHVLTADALSLG
jgi:hypothetical protein